MRSGWFVMGRKVLVGSDDRVYLGQDLEIIFSKFGKCKCEIIRDHETGDSLNFAFIEFDDVRSPHNPQHSCDRRLPVSEHGPLGFRAPQVEACEEAYKKMDNVLIDDRRIKVDFSQSVAKEWCVCLSPKPEIYLLVLPANNPACPLSQEQVRAEASQAEGRPALPG
jgi:hypothetical protein